MSADDYHDRMLDRYAADFYGGDESDDEETDTDEARQATGLEVERDQLSATAGAPHPYLALYDAVSAYDLAAKATP